MFKPHSKISRRGPILGAALALLAALAAPPGRLLAQEAAAGGSLRLSVPEAVERALASNEEARAARAAVDRTEGQVREAFSRALPKIDGSYQMTRNLQRPVIFFNQGGQTNQITIGDANEHAFGLTLEQPIFDRSLGAAVKAARHGRAASEATYDRTLANVALATRKAYYDALLAGARVRVRENALKLAQERLKQVQLFRDVGTASEFDLLTARVAVENEKPALIRARNDLRLARNDLKREIGVELDREVELTDTLAYRPVDLDLDRATARAVAGRADLVAQRQTVELNRNLVSVQSSDAFPTLSLRLNLSRRASSSDFIPQDRDFSQSASAALSLSIPIFDGRETSGRTLQARADLVQAEERLHGLENDVRVDVLDAWQSVQAAAEQVDATRATVDQAQRAYDIAIVRFRNGLSTQLELDEAEQGLFEAQSNAAEALYEHMLAVARLDNAVGER